ncbi:hypothetical protein [Nostoc sp.]|uniref:hypothetical protein n=1 Tax=Nostoc sp. TaxID=1180 RepID=UPI002FF81185
MSRQESPTGNAYGRLRLKTCGRAAIEVHFQPEALNEVLKGFALKLTPMSIAVPLPRGLFAGGRAARSNISSQRLETRFENTFSLS